MIDETTGVGLAPAPTVTIRLTRPMLRELRVQLLTSTIDVELELVEETYPEGDVVVRLRRPDKPTRGEIILGHRRQTYCDGR
jgi:hypothetical protein